jgi:hypothetical protein
VIRDMCRYVLSKTGLCACKLHKFIFSFTWPENTAVPFVGFTIKNNCSLQCGSLDRQSTGSLIMYTGRLSSTLNRS